MSLKVKLFSMISAFVLVLSMLLVGVLAATQTINLKGTVNFNISDRTLYLKDMRIQTESTGQASTADNFMPGFIGGEIDINLGTVSSSSGSVNVYFDFVNTTSTAYQASATGGSGVTLSTSGTIEGSQVEIENVTTADILGTITLTIQFTGSTGSIDLNGITISFSEYIDPAPQRVDADGNPDPNGSYLLFGYYPQTIKANDVIVNEEQPESNGYYLGSDGEYYAQVSADPYNSSYTFSNGSTIEDGQDYYFKVEKLMWRILDEDYNGTGNALIVCNTLVDVVPYLPNYTQSGNYCYATDEEGNILIDETATPGEGVDDNYQVYANNYKHSEIREYLNNTFYNTAFSDEEKSYIVTTTVDNSLESTNNNGGQYVCENTFDNVFALSYSETDLLDYMAFYNTDYTLASHAYNYTSGTYADTGVGWLRSPYDFGGGRAYAVRGGVFANGYGNSDIGGVVPALQIML